MLYYIFIKLFSGGGGRGIYYTFICMFKFTNIDFQFRLKGRKIFEVSLEFPNINYQGEIQYPRVGLGLGIGLEIG